MVDSRFEERKRVLIGEASPRESDTYSCNTKEIAD